MYINPERPPYLATEYRNGGSVSHHLIHMPSFSEKGFYRNTVSASAFSGRELKRMMANHWRWISLRWDGLQTKALDYKLHHNDPHLLKHARLGDRPRFDHESIWDFYLAIGYDYKKQRYISEPDVSTYGKDLGSLSLLTLEVLAGRYWPDLGTIQGE